MQASITVERFTSVGLKGWLVSEHILDRNLFEQKVRNLNSTVHARSSKKNCKNTVFQ